MSGHTAGMWELINAFRFVIGNSEERRPFRDLGIDSGVTKLVVKKYDTKV
jgi:hypothetical protein